MPPLLTNGERRPHGGFDRRTTHALTAEALAQALQEPNLPLLRQVLRTVGHARCVALLAETLQVEAQGGLPTRDGTWRRTPGGLFFRLTKERATPEERRRLFPRPALPPRGGTRRDPQALQWSEAQRAMEACAFHPVGEATTMKLSVAASAAPAAARPRAHAAKQ